MRSTTRQPTKEHRGQGMPIGSPAPVTYVQERLSPRIGGAVQGLARRDAPARAPVPFLRGQI